MHTICTLKPKEKIYLICSKETKNFTGSVLYNDFVSTFVKENKLKLSASDKLISIDNIGYQNNTIQIKSRIINSNNSDDVINVIQEIAESEIRENKKIAIDITGGKKIMLAGAFTIASIFSIKGYYVDFEEYNLRTGKPIYGTEFLNKVRNPLVDFEIYKNNRRVYEKILGLGKINITTEEMKEIERIEKQKEEEIKVIMTSDRTIGIENP